MKKEISLASVGNKVKIFVLNIWVKTLIQWILRYDSRPTEHINTLKPEQNGCHISDTFKYIFTKENFCILIKKNSRKLVFCPTDDRSAVV